MAQETVTVASKLPNGLVLQDFRPRDEQELVMGGGSRTVPRYYPTGERFVINGVAREAGKMPMARGPSGRPEAGTIAPMTDAGYVLTHGVPKALWEAWLEQNKDSDCVKNGLIFAHRQEASVKAQAKDHERLRSGLEPIDPDNPGGGVEPSEEQKKRKRAA